MLLMATHGTRNEFAPEFGHLNDTHKAKVVSANQSGNFFFGLLLANWASLDLGFVFQVIEILDATFVAS